MYIFHEQIRLRWTWTMVLWALASKGFCELVIIVHSTLSSLAKYRFNCLLINLTLLSLTLYQPYIYCNTLNLFYPLYLLGLDLDHVNVLPQNQRRARRPTICVMTLPLTTGSSIPPVPPSLVQKIESGAFIELGDLDLGFEETVGSKCELHPITNISEWLQAFAVYSMYLLYPESNSNV